MKWTTFYIKLNTFMELLTEIIPLNTVCFPNNKADQELKV